MKPLKHWLAGAILSVTLQSVNTYSETPIEAFMARVESQQFNTQVLSLPTGVPSSVQMYMGQPATTINLDTIGLFDLPDFKIELPGLENVFAIKEKVKNNRFSGRNWTGDVFFLDPYGFETGVQGRAYFVEKNGEITGVINTADEMIQVFPDGAGGQIIIRTGHDDAAPEGEPLRDESGAQTQGAAAPIVGGRIDGESPATMANPYTVDVMYVVTPATAAAVADVQTLIELSLTTGNDVLENSLIPMRLRWVGTHFTPDYQETDLMTPSLYDMRNTNDSHMDEVHGVRQTLGADMVMLVSSASNYCGLAFLDADPSLAFSAVFHGCMSSYTPIHEFGHNFGADHDLDNGHNIEYSFGYGQQNDLVEPYWRTVMSYACEGVYCARIPYFSTPELTYNDLPLGDPETHDNARVLRVRAAEVAGFHPAEVAYCTEHTSSNGDHVSAGRAYTQSSGGIFPTTTYYAVGSDDSLGTYSFSSNTLAEQPAGYFAKASCGQSGETPFPPEVQNLLPTVIFSGVRVEGEVFDANSDDITAVEAKLSSETSWLAATVTGSDFSIEIPVVVLGDIDVDIRATDSTGATYSITKTFTLELGEPPVITHSSTSFADQTVFIHGNYTDPDNAVTEIRYQIDGVGDPAQGIWESSAISNTYWDVEIQNVAVGARTIHFYGVDESNQNSNVLSTSITLPAAQAPLCVLAGASPRYSGAPGEIDIHGFTEDVNQGDIHLEYRLDSGAWQNIITYNRSNYREVWSAILPQTYTDNSSINIEARATDSTGLVTNCGAITHTVTYPAGDEAPSCEFTEIARHQGYLRYFMLTSDVNGDQAQIYAKEASQATWQQAWPAVLTQGGVDLPGYGSFTIEGRVVDSTGLEGFCQQTITLANEGYTPIVDGAYGYFDSDLNTVIASINAIDWDWSQDVNAVQVRAVGAGPWVSASRIDDRNWQADLGLLANGSYSYEVRASDVAGHVSDIYHLEFTINRPVAPVLSNVTYTISGRGAIVNGETFDENGNLDQIFFTLNGNALPSMDASASWGRYVNDLVDGTNTIVVYATDTDGLESAHETLTFDFDPGVAPVIANTSMSIDPNDLSVHINVNAADVDDNISRLEIDIDGTETRSFQDFNSGYWSVTVSNLGEGPHQIIVTVVDTVGNISTPEVLDFTIAAVQTCFSATNEDHVAEGRANTQLIGQTCYGTICFGGTTTYFANGSNDDLGTNASAMIDLDETATDFFEIGTCSTVDTTAPVITLNGASPMDVALGATFSDPGASASDNVDGDISANITVSGSVDTAVAGSYQLAYNVSDAAGNAAVQVTRTVNVVSDTVAPVITLIGDSPMSVNVGSTFSDPGASATDNVDGDISSNVVVSGSVNTAVIGSYVLTYDVSDVAGNAATQVSRTVDVVAASNCFTSTLADHTTAGRAYTQYSLYYATGTATYLGSTYSDTNTVVSLEESTPGNWSSVTSCN